MRGRILPACGAINMALSFIMAGCSHPANSYEVGAINLTNEDLADVAFHSRTVNSGFGVLRQGTDFQKTMGIYSVPLPPVGTVEWTTPDGVQHSASATIPPKPVPFDGILWLKIMPDGSVVAVPLTGKEYYDQHLMP